MSLNKWETMQDQKEDLKILDEWKSCLYSKENIAEDCGKERAVETLNFRPQRLYWSANFEELS